MKKIIIFLCAMLFAFVVYTSTVYAITVVGSFEGTIVNGIDQMGLFGSPGTDLDGKAISGQFTYEAGQPPAPDDKSPDPDIGLYLTTDSAQALAFFKASITIEEITVPWELTNPWSITIGITLLDRDPVTTEGDSFGILRTESSLSFADKTHLHLTINPDSEEDFIQGDSLVQPFALPTAWPNSYGTINWHDLDDKIQTMASFEITSAEIEIQVNESIGDTIDELEDIVNDNLGLPVADKTEDCLAQLQTTLDELNKIPPDNQAAIGNLEGAVGDLEAAVNDGLLDPEEGAQLMDQLALIAKQLAQDAIDEAKGTPGSDEVVIGDAEQSLADGDALRVSGAFKDAVGKYKDALAKAESALP